MPLDAGILDTVVALRALGIHTTQSCEGHASRGLAGPWVDICDPVGEKVIDRIIEFRRATKDKKPLPKNLVSLRDKVTPQCFRYSGRILRLVAAFYRQRKTPFENRILLDYAYSGSVRLMCQGTLPNGVAHKSLKTNNLKRYQKEFREFTKFLYTRIT